MLITRAASAKAISTNTLVVLFLFAGVAAGQSNQSVYTSLEVKQCRTIKGADAGDYEGRCRGLAGYALVLVEGDLRQNITVVTPAGAKHSLDLWEVVSGGFSSVGSKAEWRVTKRNGKLTPMALIIRYNANEDPEQPQKVNSYLAVIKVTSAEICVTDKIAPGPKANEEARRAADTASTKTCLKPRI